jgi:hypothetical protein
MDSLYFSLRFSPDWQGDDSIQTRVGRSGGFDHLFVVDPRPAPRKSAMKNGQSKWPSGLGLAVVWKSVYQLQSLCVSLTRWIPPRMGRK